MISSIFAIIYIIYSIYLQNICSCKCDFDIPSPYFRSIDVILIDSYYLSQFIATAISTNLDSLTLVTITHRQRHAPKTPSGQEMPSTPCPTNTPI